MPDGQPVVEHVEDETDPEVLLYVTGQGVETARRRFEHVPLILLR